MPAEFTGDPYATLGVARDSSPTDIKSAYRRLAKASHPDVDESPDAMAAMVRINGAYAILTDRARRARWDALNPLPRPGRPPGPTPPSTRSGPGATPSRPSTGPIPYARPGPGAGTRSNATGPPPKTSGTKGTTIAPPSLDEAFAFRMGTGKHHGRTLHAIAELEPDYLRWIVRSVKDRPRLVACARLVVEHLDALGDGRPTRPPARPSSAATASPRHPHPTRPPAPHASTPLAAFFALPEGRRERLLLVGVATLAALATFVVAWIVIALLGS